MEECLKQWIGQNEDLSKDGTIQFIGPVNAPVFKVNDIYRKILYIKCEKCAILDQIRGQIETLAASDTKWQAVQIQYDIS